MAPAALALLLQPWRLVSLAKWVVFFFCICWFAFAAVKIRMYPIDDFGYLIHEFDPWFNYRAAEYMAKHGVSAFFKWYDYMSWYPVGRPVGTTIYPGMQLVAYAIWSVAKRLPTAAWPVPKFIRSPLVHSLNWMRLNGFMNMYLPKIPKAIEISPWTLNQVCCLIPPYFAALASIFTGLLAYEVSGSASAGVVAMGVMAVIPGHLQRSVGGEFDNEAVALAAICLTSWLWVRSLRTTRSWPIGFLAGLSYAFLAASWGGYIFVLNLVGIHALLLVCLGRFNSAVHRAYTLFFVVGTFGAMQIPVIGWAPLRSLEQIGPLLVFFGYQALALCDLGSGLPRFSFIKVRVGILAALLVALAVAGYLLYPTGYFGPISSRIRGVFVKHTKTGNPLVDSVAEHQPASEQAFQYNLNLPFDYAFLGVALCVLHRTPGSYFLVLYGAIVMHFSRKMARLVLLCSPVCSVACGIWCGFWLDQMLEPVLLLLRKPPVPRDQEWLRSLPVWQVERPGGMTEIKLELRKRYFDVNAKLHDILLAVWRFVDRNPVALLARIALSVYVAKMFMASDMVTNKIPTFIQHCDTTARGMSNPQIVYWGRTNDGKAVKVTDYLDGYRWVDKNTPKDARVIAWWDYGYQITGIAKRTSLADGNTWNHEHIATIGVILTSSEQRAHKIIRHLADYVLVWAGGGGDDLAKSTHLARIGNSVFPSHCGDDDPTCNKFGFTDQGPTPMMHNSLLYKLVMHNKGATVNSSLFEEVHSTRYGKMRVFKVMNVSKKSKEWVAKPENRICDAPGSWYCVGQYPPAIMPFIKKRKSFAQIEDFNKKKTARSAYEKHVKPELDL